MYEYNQSKADHAINFFESLTLSTGEYAGQKLKLMPWQKEPLSAIFGNVNAEGLRQYNEALFFLPARQGKTTLASAIALYFLLDPTEPHGFIMSVGPTLKQASFIFDEIDNFVSHDRQLQKVLKSNKSHKTWEHTKTGTMYQAYSSEPKAVPGVNANLIIMDEIHAFEKRDIWDLARRRRSSRRNALWLTLTTAGSRINEQDLCYQEYMYACKVRDGIIKNDRYLPVIYSAPDHAPLTIETVKACNPSVKYGIKKIEVVESELQKAKEIPSYERSFRREELNQWLNIENGYFDIDAWKKCGKPFKEEDLYGCEAWAGYDQGGQFDLGAFVLIVKKDDKYYIVPKFTVPELRLPERLKRDKIDYGRYASLGQLILTPGNFNDGETTKKLILDAQKNYKMKMVAIDPYYLRDIAVELQTKHNVLIQEVSARGYALSASMKEVEKKIMNNEFIHNNNEVMTWCVSNLVVDKGAYGDVKPSREKSTEKIDGAVGLILAQAAIMATTIKEMENPEQQKKVVTSARILFA